MALQYSFQLRLFGDWCRPVWQCYWSSWPGQFRLNMRDRLGLREEKEGCFVAFVLSMSLAKGLAHWVPNKGVWEEHSY